jgi:hypothetical protein
MHWQKVIDRNSMPKDRQFIALWKGIPCISEYEEDSNTFFVCFHPSVYGVMHVDSDREMKFTHWCEIFLPEDY